MKVRVGVRAPTFRELGRRLLATNLASPALASPALASPDDGDRRLNIRMQALVHRTRVRRVLQQLLVRVAVATFDRQLHGQSTNAPRRRIHVLLNGRLAAHQVDVVTPRDNAHRRQDAARECGGDQVGR